MKICGQANIIEVDSCCKFSIVLVLNDLRFYFDVIVKGNFDFLGLKKDVKGRLKTPERTRAILRQ